MRMHYLDDATVDAYLMDLVKCRMPVAREKCSNAPLVICYIGHSGRALLDRLFDLPKSAVAFLDSALIIRAQYDRANHIASFYHFDPQNRGKDAVIAPDRLHEIVSGAHVLLLDSSVHSGSSMQALAEILIRAGLKAITSYGLVVKSTAVFIPNYFGLMMGYDDRALFLLKEIPNNRIMPSGLLRLLSEADLSRDRVISGVDSIDRSTWSDMYFAMTANPEVTTFVYHSCEQFQAYLTVTLVPNRTLALDVVAVDKNSQKQNLGGHLVRWAETYARHNGCNAIELWGIDAYVGWYQKHGFTPTGKKQMLPEKNSVEIYHQMRKQIVFDRLGIVREHLLS